MTKRSRYSNDFGARVALEAIREELTLAELSKKHGGHPNMISGWKRSAIKNMADGLGKDDGGAARDAGAEIDKLHSKIGRFVIERNFFGERLGSTARSMRQKW